MGKRQEGPGSPQGEPGALDATSSLPPGEAQVPLSAWPSFSVAFPFLQHPSRPLKNTRTTLNASSQLYGQTHPQTTRQSQTHCSQRLSSIGNAQSPVAGTPPPPVQAGLPGVWGGVPPAEGKQGCPGQHSSDLSDYHLLLSQPPLCYAKATSDFNPQTIQGTTASLLSRSHWGSERG